MKHRLTAILLLLIIFMFIMLVGCDSRPPEKAPMSRQYFEYFDTVSIIYSYCDESAAEFDSNCSIVENVLSEYHKLLDIYYEYDGINNLCTVNKNAGIAPVKVDRNLIDFLLYAKEMCRITNGETNIALGSVLKLWHDRRDEGAAFPEKASIPSQEELNTASLHTLVDDIIIDTEDSTVFLSDKDMLIDVGALGKGYATEKARDALVHADITSYVLNIGGNIRAIGTKPGGNGWRTAIKDPFDKSRYALTVNISDTSCVTSGNYERYYTVGGVRYHHIIDKDTLMPADYFASVTVFANNSALADALSTALFCMPYEDGLALIKGIGGAEAYWISTSGEEYMTEGVQIAE